MKANELVEQLINKMYGQSVVQYKNFLKEDLVRIINELKETEKRMHIFLAQKTEECRKMFGENNVYYTRHVAQVEVKKAQFATKIRLYQDFLTNMDGINIVDIDMKDWELFDFKIKKLHETFIEQLINEISDRLIKNIEIN